MAMAVLLRVCGVKRSPWRSMPRMLSFLDWASVRLEQDPTSK